uniref:PilN domain-containing protein n=1 Tax=candidate division CPR3 bacterium TaxID=2268181 RepID=A0A7C4M1T6_UNCC3
MIDIDVSKIISEIGESKARFIENEEQKRQRIRVFVFCSVFLFLLALGSVLFFALDRNIMGGSSVLSSDVEKIKEDNKQYISFEKEARAIQNRNRDALGIILENPTWSYVFDKIEKIIPQGVTITRFEVESSDQMRMSGTATDYSNLSKLVVAMEDYKVLNGEGKEEKVFNNVNIKSASLAKIKERVLIDFSISFSFVKKINRASVNPSDEKKIENDAKLPETKPVIESPVHSLPNVENNTTNPNTPVELPNNLMPAAPENPTTPNIPENPVDDGSLPVL